MSRIETRGLSHVLHMLAEIEAELDALEAGSQAVRALRQLDEREARGEPLTSVCGATLRDSLQQAIALSPIGLARRKVAELRAILDGTAWAVASAASPNVIDLQKRRLAAAKPVWRRFQVASRAAAMSLMLAVFGFAGLAHLPGLGRAPMIDITAPSAPHITWASVGQP